MRSKEQTAKDERVTTKNEDQSPTSPTSIGDVYVMDISYFSGKFESYLRYKELPYRRHPVSYRQLYWLFEQTGTMKVPTVFTTQGEWLKDTTPMIRWFEKKHGGPPVLPEDPALAFVASLLEDFADEWLWRPAMWWRWMPKVSQLTLGHRVAEEVVHDFPPPSWFLRRYFAWRQRREWLWDDGMTQQNSPLIRDLYLQQLDALQALLTEQPFLLGSHPSVADFGYMGPFFRHFSQDPDPAEMMRQRGPAVYEWTARVWNTRASRLSEEPTWIWPEHEAWHPIFQELMGVYLPYLLQNAMAWQSRQRHFDFRAGAWHLRRTRTTQYRVWCREQLCRQYQELTQEDRQCVDELFAPFGDFRPLEQGGPIESGLEQDLELPLRPRKRPSWLTRLWVQAFGTPRDIPTPTLLPRQKRSEHD